MVKLFYFGEIYGLGINQFVNSSHSSSIWLWTRKLQYLKVVQNEGLRNWNWIWFKNLTRDEEGRVAVLNAAVHVQEGARDPYKWMSDESKGFSVKGCYELMSCLRFSADFDADFMAQCSAYGIHQCRRKWVYLVGDYCR